MWAFVCGPGVKKYEKLNLNLAATSSQIYIIPNVTNKDGWCYGWPVCHRSKDNMNDNIFGKLYRQVVLEFYHDNKEGERVVANINEERKEHFADLVQQLDKQEQIDDACTLKYLHSRQLVKKPKQA